ITELFSLNIRTHLQFFLYSQKISWLTDADLVSVAEAVEDSDHAVEVVDHDSGSDIIPSILTDIIHFTLTLPH
ncbi:unnamed protein product, partial [Allacma fusca]